MIASPRRLATGEVLFREGDPGHQAYLIESGSIEIFIERADGIRVLARLGADELFGEMALLGDRTRSAGARASMTTVLSVVTHETLTEHLAQASPVLRHLLTLTLARCRDTVRLVGGEKPHHSSLTLAAVGGRAPGDRDLAVQRLRIEQALHVALARGELELFYQPIVSLLDSRTVGFEPLVRWRRNGTLVPPSEFIWVLEESPLIIEFGRWAVRTAAAGLRELQTAAQQRAVGPLLFASVNLSVRQLGDPELFPTIATAIADNGLRPEQMRFEITESVVLNNLEAALELLTRCRQLGCKLVVDDFGTGYSALSYLHRLPLHGLKLDRSFVQDAATNERGLRIVRAIGQLASDLQMFAVAEGIETAQQAALCLDIGVDYGQGYFFGRPAPLTEAITTLSRSGR